MKHTAMSAPISLFIALQILNCWEMENAFSEPVMLPTRGKRFVFYTLWLSQVAQRCANIGIEQDGLLFKTLHGDGLAQIDAGVDGLPIPGRRKITGLGREAFLTT